MFRKFLKILVPIILISIILLIARDTYKKTKVATVSPLTIIPVNASMIFQLNDVINIGSKLNNSNIFHKLQNIKRIETILQDINQLSRFYTANQTIFTSNSIFLSLHQVSAKKIAVLYSTSFERRNMVDNKDIISLFDNNTKTFKYDNKIIFYSELLDIYFSFKENILFYSSNKMLVTDAIRTSDVNSDNLFATNLFSECYKTISKSADINLMINYNSLFSLGSIISNTKLNISSFSEWIATDIKLKENAVLYSGMGTLDNSVNNFTDIFNSQKNQSIDILDIIPQSTTKIFSISFTDQIKVYTNKNKILQKNNEFWNWDKNRRLIEDSTGLDYMAFINEIDDEAGIFNTSKDLSLKDTYSYIKTKESIRVSSMLQVMITSSSDYKDYRINKISDNNMVANLFGPLFKAENSFFTIIDDFIIFGNSIVSLEYIIDNYISENIFSRSKSFKNLRSYISDDSNIFFYINPGKTYEFLSNNFFDKELLNYNPDSLAKFTALTLQVNITGNDMIHNMCLFHDDNYRESIKEEWYFPLDTTANMSPQFVYNHFTNDNMILLQDNSFNLIALNTLGKKIWTLSLDEPILSNIHTIDAYKNNRFQALFNTKNKLYLVDRNGEFVDGFPVNLPVPTLMGSSLLDYDSKKNYRIIINGLDNYLYNFDKKGKRVNGWKYLKTSNIINSNPQHFVVDDKDYILKSTNNSNTTKLLARNGSVRSEFKDGIIFKSPVKITDNGSLYAITNENNLWKGNVDGSSEIYDLQITNLNAEILSYDNGFYIADGSILSYMFNREKVRIKIDFDSPIKSLSYSSGLVAVLTSSSLYLLKDNKLIDGFPIDTDGYFNIFDIDNDGKLNLININNRFIYNYKLIH